MWADKIAYEKFSKVALKSRRKIYSNVEGYMRLTNKSAFP